MWTRRRFVTTAAAALAGLAGVGVPWWLLRRESRFPLPRFVRGLHVPADLAADPARLRVLLQMARVSELTAVVVDLKDARVFFPSRHPIARLVLEQAARANRPPPITSLRELVARLHDAGLYVIGRLVVFKDPSLAQLKPEWALRPPDEPSGATGGAAGWLCPAATGVHVYVAELSREAALEGVDEIQLDYIRFPDPDGRQETQCQVADRTRALAEAIRVVRAHVRGLGVPVAIDTYGSILKVPGPSRNGQQFDRLVAEADVVCPMIYPSHWDAWNNAHPRESVADSCGRAVARARAVAAAGFSPGRIVPWLQAFTDRRFRDGPTYTSAEVRKQMEGVYDAGLEEFLLWNSSGDYAQTAGAFRPRHEMTSRARRYEPPPELRRKIEGYDIPGLLEASGAARPEQKASARYT